MVRREQGQRPGRRGVGDDTVRAAVTAPSDRLTGKTGVDFLFGGPGADRITPGPGADEVTAQKGDDSVFATDDRGDEIDCGKGDDEVFADEHDIVRRNCERRGRDPLDRELAKPGGRGRCTSGRPDADAQRSSLLLPPEAVAQRPGSSSGAVTGWSAAQAVT